MGSYSSCPFHIHRKTLCLLLSSVGFLSSGLFFSGYLEGVAISCYSLGRQKQQGFKGEEITGGSEGQRLNEVPKGLIGLLALL